MIYYSTSDEQLKCIYLFEYDMYKISYQIINHEQQIKINFSCVFT